MSTSKHVRKTGAVTVKKDGKIVGNIGRGKTATPTSQKNVIKRLNNIENETTTANTLSTSQQKFDDLSLKTISFEQAQVLWNLTSEKNLAERLNILGNYIDSMSDAGKNKLFTCIENDIVAHTPITSSRYQMVQILEGSMKEVENIQPNVLDAFARCEVSEWKRAVARNKNIMTETLDFLAEDNDTWLLENVAKNPQTTSKTLTKIFDKTCDNSVLEAIACNQSTPTKILAQLSQSEIRIRKNVARHENTSADTLSYLSRDSEPMVRYAVAENWNTPPKALDDLSYDHDVQIVWCVADNSNTPYSTLKRLAKNSNKEISNAAKFGLRYSTNLRDEEKDNEHF